MTPVCASPLPLVESSNDITHETKCFCHTTIFCPVCTPCTHNIHRSRSNRKAKKEMAMAFPRLGGWMDGICNLRLQSHKHMDLFGSYTHSTPCGASCYALNHTSKQKTIKKTHTRTAGHTDVLEA